jgi:hypothetical protein
MGKKTHRERELPEPHTRVPEEEEDLGEEPVDLKFEMYREKERRE